MRTIHKYAVTDSDIEMPLGTKILSVGFQNGDDLFLWAEVSTTEGCIEHRKIRSYPTGCEVPEGVFIGTAIGEMYDEPFVLHVYELSK